MAEPYNSFLQAVSIVDLDILDLLPMNCLHTAYFEQLYLLFMATLLGPALVAVAVLAVDRARIARLSTFSSSDADSTGTARRPWTVTHFPSSTIRTFGALSLPFSFDAEWGGALSGSRSSISSL